MFTSRTLIAGVLLGSLALVACGSDDDGGGGGDTAAFCNLLAETAEGEPASDEEVLADVEALAAAAPSEISDEMNELADLFGQLASIDLEGGTEESLDNFDELLARFDEVSTAAEDWSRENCPDLPDDVFSTGG